MEILIADDYALMRRGIKDLLAEALPSARFDETSSADSVLSHMTTMTYNLVILDIHMPGKSGLDILEDIKQIRGQTPVIILNSHPENHYAVRCLRAGAAAYLNRAVAPEKLILAAKTALDGKRYIDQEQAEALLATVEQTNNRPLHEALSNREFEVMRLIAEGMALTEIADRLHLSVKTVSSYRARLLEKMRMKSNSELVRYAVANRLIE